MKGILIFCFGVFAFLLQTGGLYAQRHMEHLGRGLVATKMDSEGFFELAYVRDRAG
jgi:hypothetical protein